ncbi:MAG: PQQ-binding-like beta-propeller repeat protein [Bacteroidetes bacterium]|nr:PQQ-binding-like beta-propeller repeat protein [Bacteroidota bacterium]
MTKKILVIILVLLLIVISIFSYNFYKNIKAPINANSFVAIPQNAALIVQGKSFKDLIQKLNSSNIIWEELVNNTSLSNSYNQQLMYLDSLTSDKIINQLINTQPVIASLHQLGANGFDAVYYFTTASKIENESLINHLKSLTKSNPETRIYDEISIYNFAVGDAKKIALIYHKGIIAFSFSAILIEDVVRQLNSESSLLNDVGFNSVLSTAGESEFGNIFINLGHLNKISSSFLNKDIKPSLKDVELFSNWIALDVSIKSNALMLNGFSLAQDSTNLYLSLFKDQKPQDQELINILPKNTAFIYYNGFSDVKGFFKKKLEILKKRNQSLSYESLLENFSAENQLDIVEEWLSFLGNEMAAVITEPTNDFDFENHKFLVFKISSQEKAINSLNTIGLKINEEPHPTIPFNDYQIDRIDLKNFFTTFFGKPFFNIDKPYYTIIDDYLVFGTSENAIKEFISYQLNDKILQHDTNYTAYKENLSSTSNVFIYNNIARSVKLYPNFIAENYHTTILEKTELLQKFEAVSLQISTQKGNLFYSNFYLKYNPVYKQDTRSVWETELEGEVIGKPEIVINHTNNTREIFVQDNLNKIYLISNTGKILWTKQLSGNIIGRVYQVDALKNGKLQLLFNTAEKIYLLDRNGNNVGKFPIQLPSPATNGITPLDYEKNATYRLMIGCQNNMLYNFDIDGNLVKGWEYVAENSPATKNISHFILSNKDYIVVPLQNGKVKIIERSGKDRISLKNKLPKTHNVINLNLNSDLNKVNVSTLDSSGSVVKLYFNDKIETMNFSGIPNQSYFENFEINTDNSIDYIFAYDKTLRITDSEKHDLIKIEVNDEITHAPLFFKMPDKSIKIGLVTASNIYLMNQAGIIDNNFPLTGSTPFNITNLSNDKNLNLIVGDKKLIYMYNLE